MQNRPEADSADSREVARLRAVEQISSQRSIAILGQVIDGLTVACEQAEAGNPGARALLEQWDQLERRIKMQRAGLVLARG